MASNIRDKYKAFKARSLDTTPEFKVYSNLLTFLTKLRAIKTKQALAVINAFPMPLYDGNDVHPDDFGGSDF